MSVHPLMLKKASNGALIEAAASDTGELKISGTIEPAAGGATLLEQEAQTTLLAGGLPAALGAGGGLKIDGSGTALPVSAASLPLPTGAATSALQGGGLPAALHGGLGLKVGALDSAGAEVFPAVAVRGSTVTPPSVTMIGAMGFGYHSSGNVWRRCAINSSDEAMVANKPTSASTFSRSAGAYEEQRGIDFSFGLWQAVVYSETTGYILLVNKGSDAINGDVPYGSNVYPIQAGQTIEIGALGAGTYENFTSGCQVVFSSTVLTVTLGGAHCLITLKGA